VTSLLSKASSLGGSTTWPLAFAGVSGDAVA
jgi:hypothetical protein